MYRLESWELSGNFSSPYAFIHCGKFNKEMFFGHDMHAETGT